MDMYLHYGKKFQKKFVDVKGRLCRTQYLYIDDPLLGAFAQSRQAPATDLLSACNRAAPTERIYVKFDIEDFP
jgi:hypothetical protein